MKRVKLGIGRASPADSPPIITLPVQLCGGFGAASLP